MAKYTELQQEMMQEVETWYTEMTEKELKRREESFEVEFCDAFPALTEWREKKKAGIILKFNSRGVKDEEDYNPRIC